MYWFCYSLPLHSAVRALHCQLCKAVPLPGGLPPEKCFFLNIFKCIFYDNLYLNMYFSLLCNNNNIILYYLLCANI